VHPEVVTVMREEEIDLSDRRGSRSNACAPFATTFALVFRALIAEEDVQ